VNGILSDAWLGFSNQTPRTGAVPEGLEPSGPGLLSARSGLRASIPIARGVGPSGLVFGAAAVTSGFTVVDVALLSSIVYAGASQLVMVELARDQTSVAVLVLAMAMVNLRLMLYSASMAPHLSLASRRTRVISSYFLTDQTFARCITAFRSDSRTAAKVHYYFGVGVPVWLTWQFFSVLGAIVGRSIPTAIPLGFTIPLLFLAVLVPSLTSRRLVLTSSTAALVSILLVTLPFNLGMLLGALSGLGIAMTLSGSRGMSP
jgi:predicted branched-subunit amino acid permease